MSSEMKTASALRAHLYERAAEDGAFRALLLADPVAAINEELGLTIPPGFTVAVHEETADTSHLVLPPAARLSEGDLEQAAGGARHGYLRRRHWYSAPSDTVFVPTTDD